MQADNTRRYLGSEIELERNKEYFKSFNNLAYGKFAKEDISPETFKEHCGTLTLLKSRISNPLPDSLKELNLPQNCIAAISTALYSDIDQIAGTSRDTLQSSVSPAWSYCVFDAAEQFDNHFPLLNRK
jgi:hypothetical protein